MVNFWKKKKYNVQYNEQIFKCVLENSDYNKKKKTLEICKNITIFNLSFLRYGNNLKLTLLVFHSFNKNMQMLEVSSPIYNIQS